MIRYFAAAVGLKLFSINDATRSVYRRLGNVVGQKRRQQQNIDEYVARGRLLVEIFREQGLLKEDLSILEIGTGWIHWFALFLALHSGGRTKLDLFDVWDNRQLDALRSSFGALQDRWRDDSGIPAERLQRLSDAIEVNTFDELYEKFNATYKIDRHGSLESYNDSTFDAVFSFHVLEHVGRGIINDSVRHMSRVLKPGGYCIHQIGIDDHLAHYDRRESKKSYLKYSLSLRKRLFENIVQYHNALQGSDFLECFGQQDFEVIDISREKISLDGVSIHSDWRKYSQEDLETTLFTVVLRKPL